MIHDALREASTPPPWPGVPPERLVYCERGHRRLAACFSADRLETMRWFYLASPPEKISATASRKLGPHKFATASLRASPCAFYKDPTARQRLKGQQPQHHQSPVDGPLHRADHVDRQDVRGGFAVSMTRINTMVEAADSPEVASPPTASATAQPMGAPQPRGDRSGGSPRVHSSRSSRAARPRSATIDMAAVRAVDPLELSR